ncbi:hypothetical protein PTTG_27992 [Puccinia triticina 1-1 BBBD Race 1]|uniref:Uncharacterized protein n=1 Tax=Puccinia triticina (isolate 1-1 / race 1 (BBBD)) TaxID=630390 RepID=A0A180GFT3_PUCT1|nr:hypothetical protein PTTG_27992 [Puccinia triticina 1-1 BBBD Race 1]
MEDCCIDVYKAAINPKILEIAIQKDSWKTATDLKQKMALCVLASNVLDELNMLRSNLSTKRAYFQLQRPPPPSPVSTSTPMDIDAITASVGFTFSPYCARCVKHKLCQRCHKTYDEAHISNRSCPNVEVQMKDKIALFTKLSQGVPLTIQLTQINVAATKSGSTPASWDHIGPGSFTDMLMYGCDETGAPLDNGKSSFPSHFISLNSPSLP